jgi:hypothetical protein
MAQASRARTNAGTAFGQQLVWHLTVGAPADPSDAGSTCRTATCRLWSELPFDHSGAAPERSCEITWRSCFQFPEVWLDLAMGIPLNSCARSAHESLLLVCLMAGTEGQPIAIASSR